MRQHGPPLEPWSNDPTPLPDQDVLSRSRRVEHPAMRSQLPETATGEASSVEGSDDDHEPGLPERSEAGESLTVSDQEQVLPVVLTLFPADDGLQHCSAALAECVASYTRQLDVGILQHLLDPACNARVLLR